MPTCRLQKIEQPKLSQNLSEYIEELLGKENKPLYPENGILKGVVYDKYDYKRLYKEYYNNYPATIYNNGAWGLQKIKHLEDYYYFIPVRFKY